MIIKLVCVHIYDGVDNKEILLISTSRLPNLLDSLSWYPKFSSTRQVAEFLAKKERSSENQILIGKVGGAYSAY
jgi:hypothetical protein